MREDDRVEELVQWFGEQLDEDERIARQASGRVRKGAHWSLDEWSGREVPHSLIAYGSVSQPVWGHFTADPVPTAQAEHIVEHDPARVLREIDAKRQLLAAYVQVAANDVNDVEYAHGYANALGEAVRLLALPYADRPGYREEWRP
jgi:hypothetical protein